MRCASTFARINQAENETASTLNRFLATRLQCEPRQKAAAPSLYQDRGNKRRYNPIQFLDGLNANGEVAPLKPQNRQEKSHDRPII